MALQTLSIDLEARLVKFTQDMGQAARVTEKSAQQMSAALGVVKASIGGLAAGITFGGLVSLTKNAINSLDALNDLKDATGASIENISALEDVAARTGTTMDAVGTSLVKFNAVLKDAKPGSDQEAAFKALNLSIKELQNLDPAEALRRTAVALAGYADDGNKARLVQELFGKSIREVAPFLKDLAEQGALVAKVTTQQAEEAEKFNKELFNMQKNVQDLTRYLTGGLIGALNRYAEAARKAKADQTGLFASIQSMADKANAQSSAMFTGSWATGNAGRGSVNPAFVKPSLDFNGAPAKTKVAREIKELDLSNKALASYIDTLERNVQKTQNLSNEEEALIFLRKQGTGASLEQAAAVLDLARALDAEAEQNERVRIGRQAAIDQGVDNTDYQNRLKALLDSGASAKLKAITDDVRLLADEFEAQRITQDQYVEAVQARIGGIGEEVAKTKTFAEEMGLTFSSAFEDAIVGGNKLSTVIKGLGQDILRITIRKAVTQPLGDFFSKALTSTFGGFFAGGGNPPVGKASIVGEQGPEWFIPKTAGTIVPNGQGIGGQVVIQITQQVGDIATVSMLQKSNDLLVRKLQAGLRRSQGYGGAMA